MTQFVDQRTFHKLASAGDAPGAAVERLGSVARAADDGSRIVRFVLSDGLVDRMGDTIAVKGWVLDDYRRNPTVLWAHLSNEPPIGRMVRIFVANERLMGDVEFASAATYPFADTIYHMVLDGFIRACSVGFLPLEWKFSDDRKFGIDFIRQELLELSICPVGANANALIEARSKGWGRSSAAPTELSEAALSTMSFSGTLQQRKAQLAAVTRADRHARAAQARDLALTFADSGTVEGRRRIVRAHRHFIESTSR
jgi:HK97 family phage prohead protease